MPKIPEVEAELEEAQRLLDQVDQTLGADYQGREKILEQLQALADQVQQLAAQTQEVQKRLQVVDERIARKRSEAQQARDLAQARQDNALTKWTLGTDGEIVRGALKSTGIYTRRAKTHRVALWRTPKILGVATWVLTIHDLPPKVLAAPQFQSKESSRPNQVLVSPEGDNPHIPELTLREAIEAADKVLVSYGFYLTDLENS